MMNVAERFGLLPAADFEFETVTDGTRITRTSISSGKRNAMVLPVTREQVERWSSERSLVQNAFPNLNAEQREFLLSGMTPEEWNDTFPPEDEEDA
jgi:hypothetical protein